MVKFLGGAIVGAGFGMLAATYLLLTGMDLKARDDELKAEMLNKAKAELILEEKAKKRAAATKTKPKKTANK